MTQPKADRRDIDEAEEALRGLVVTGGGTAGIFQLVEAPSDQRTAFVQGVHDLRPVPRQCPTPKLQIDARPYSRLLRQVAPGRTGASDPENSIKNTAVIGRFTPVGARELPG